MKQKHKQIKILKSAIVSVLLVCLLISSMPITYAAQTTFKSLNIEDIEIVQNTEGYYNSEYDSATDDYIDWYYYTGHEYNIVGTATLTDGSTIDIYGPWLNINDNEYHINITDEQSYENQWGLGAHQVTAELEGVKTTFNVNIVESPVKSLTVDDIDIIKNTNGNEDFEYNPDTEDWDLSWYKYDNFGVTGKVTLNDGSICNIENGEFEYKDDYYSLDFETDQSYENQWDIGTHNAVAKALGFETTFNVNIVESPIKSMAIDDIDIIKNTNGNEDFEYNPDTEDWDLSWYRYYNFDVTGKVTLIDGSTRNIESGDFEYKDDYYYSLDFETDQSYENQWDIGTHKAVAKVLGYETTFNVNIVESPVKSIEIENIEIIEKSSGSIVNDYNPETGVDDLEYFRYEYNPSFTVYFKDGTVSKDNTDSVEYKGEYYSLSIGDDQSYENQWGIGTHRVTASVLGYEFDFNVNIIEGPYMSLEILEVKPIAEKSNTNYYTGYEFPQFKYKVVCKDGTSFVDMYMGEDNCNDSYLHIQDEEIRDTWSVGNNNYFDVSYCDINATVQVEIIPASGYEYIEQNGGLYITNINNYQKNIEIPSEIDGKKVIGIISLGNATDTVENLTIPDSIISIGQEALKWCRALKVVNIGSGVDYLNADMFSVCEKLESINISSNNKNYADEDGIVYNFSKDTLVVYPLGKGENYKIPANVNNIDILDSWQYDNVNVTFSDESKSYKTVDGVTYTSDMTKIVRCNNDKSGKYDMPNTVTSISSKAFSDCDNLTEVNVSNKVTQIAYGAFENCTSLANVSMPDTIKKIDTYAFNNCSSLKEVNLPKSLESIEHSAFYNSGLTSVVIPDNVTKLGTWTFSSCSSLKSAKIGAGLTEIADDTFSDCALTQIEIPENISKIGNSAFSRNKIESIKIPDSVVSMGTEVFDLCQKLKNIQIGSSLTEIPRSTFSGCSALEEVTIPENITKIGDYAFGNCENLNNLDIKNKSVEIGDGVFSGCPLKNYKFDTNIKSFGKFSFAGTDIESVDISKTVTEIAYGSFFNCEKLQHINVPDNVLKISRMSFDNTKWYDNQPDGEVYLNHIFYNYKGNMPQNAAINVKNGTKTIADYAFGREVNLEQITLPEGLKRIGGLAFNNCSNLKVLNVPASVEDIGPYAFTGCSSLTAINVSPDNKYYASVDGVLFNKDKTELIYCPKQNTDSYTVPASVKKIRAFAFDCACVDNITIANKDIELEEYAIGFNLGELILPEDSSKDAGARYCGATVSCPKDSTTEQYAKEHLIDISSYIEPTTLVVCGDADENGFVDISDATVIQRYLARFEVKAFSEKGADADQDEKITITDATAIQRHLAHLLPNSQVGNVITK